MTRLQKGIAVVGSTTIDHILSDNRSIFKVGGVTTYAGITYRRHGINTIVVSNLAGQDLGILERLRAEDIIVFNEDSESTTCFVNDYRDESRRQEMRRKARPIDIRQIRELLKNVDCLHLGPLHPLDIELSALEILRNSTSTIFVDLQGFTRKVENGKIVTAASKHLEAGLSVAQIAKANSTELKTVLDYYQISLKNLVRRFKIDEFVVTLGTNGGFVETRSGTTFQYKADTVKNIVDPTGAGDVFFAGYILSRFLDKKKIKHACSYAARLAAYQVEGRYISDERLGL